MKSSSFLRFILCCISTVGVFVALLPLFLLYTSDEGFTTDGFSFIIKSDLSKTTSLLAPLFIVIIPLVDILLDFCQNICHWPYNKKSLKKQNAATLPYRMTDKERLVFIIGMILQSTICFLPSYHFGLPKILVIYRHTSVAAQILLLAPILFYLERCTTTFTPFIISSILISVVIGVMLLSLKILYRFDFPTFFGGLGIALYIATATVSLILHCIEKYVARTNRRFCTKLFTDSMYNFLIPIKSDDKQNKSDEDFMYTQYIPAMHMLVYIITSVSGLFFLNGTLHFDAYNYVTVFGHSLVLIIELRIRKYEVERGLTALLNSKKLYVRYISHELRTPLNTAYLGLKLLMDEFKASIDVEDIERYDTLHDVSRSCEAAIDILNDLLCYEKLESGILELHTEKITVLPYLSDCLSMFAVQARECGVVMRIDTEVNDTHRQADMDNTNKCQVTLPLQNFDTVFIDKFKMNQVIRNLVSNALKFTPIGGNVIMQAVFVHDVEGGGEGRGLDGGKGGLAPHNKSFLRYFVDCLRCRSLQINPVCEGNGTSGANLISTLNQNGEEIVSAIAGNLVLVVTDTGVGMSANNQKRLFNEIIQFDPEKLQAGGGSGLGLWITSGIMDMHGGQISVASGGEGKGSSFTVKIPMLYYPTHDVPPHPHNTRHFSVESCTPPIPAFQSAIQMEPLLESSRRTELQEPSPVNEIQCVSHRINPLPSYEILVVDDSNLNRKMLIKCLEAEHHVCEYAVHGQQAIEKVKERIGWRNCPEGNGSLGRSYDVILMDFVMPVKDGPSATAELRAMGYSGAIFGVTGNGLTSDVEHFLSSGADKVLIKPLDMKSFSATMKERFE